MKNKPLKPIFFKPQSVKKILKKLDRRLKWEKRDLSNKLAYFRKKKFKRRAARRVAKNSIRRNR